MAWVDTINQGPTSITVLPSVSLLFYNLKEALKAVGWTVGPSGDGVVLYSAGDCLTHAAGGVAGLGNQWAWYAANDPDGQRHFLVQMGAAWFTGILACSHDAPFLGGGFAVRAVSVDEVSPRGEAAIADSALVGAADPAYHHIVVSDTAINGVWPFLLYVETGASALGHLACIALTDGVDAGDTDPCVWSADYQQLAGARLFATGAGSRVAGWYDIAGGGKSWRGMACASLYWDASYRNPPPGSANPGQVARPDGLFRTRKAEFWLDCGVGGHWVCKGVSNWILSPTCYPGVQDWNRLFLDQNGEIYFDITLGGATPKGLCAPGWPSVLTCPLPVGLGVSHEDVEVTPQDATTSAPPTITLVSPVAGASIAADTPIVVDVTDDAGLSMVVLTCEIPAGGPHEVVWLRTAFSGYYSGSTVAVIAGGYRYTIRRHGGWPASPRFHAEAVDTSGGVGT